MKSAQKNIRDALTMPSELVLGIVSPVGTNLDDTLTALEEGLRLAGYKPEIIRLSTLLRSWNLGIPLEDEPEFARIRSHMAAGTAARAAFSRSDILALGAITEINRNRPEKGRSARPKTAYILVSLKHPEEVRTLRITYGHGFYLVGVSSSKADRIRYLISTKLMDRGDAELLVRLDEDELQPNNRPSDFGQKTRDTFELADVFVRQGDRTQVSRFLDLVFGDPFQTPTREEHAMFLAYASSLRSADLSRQVGAVVISSHGDLIATGANDVPAAGGGLYWPGESDARDFKLGKDINEQRRNDFVVDVMRRFPFKKKLREAQLLELGKEWLSGSPIFDITEFGRAVHAEMEALMSCARAGVSPRGGMLVCSTFPCHNCAKHIIAAGLAKVVYVEPYPKSQAHELFRDSITLEDLLESNDIQKSNKVLFSPFVGVGPRRYLDLFSLGLSSGYKIKRKGSGGVKVEWKRENGKIRVPMLPNSYLEREALATGELVDLMKMTEEATDARHEEHEHSRDQEVLGSRRGAGARGARLAEVETGGAGRRNSGRSKDNAGSSASSGRASRSSTVKAVSRKPVRTGSQPKSKPNSKPKAK